MSQSDTFSAAEISAVTGTSLKAVHKVLGERLPTGPASQAERQHVTRSGVLCVLLDREMPRDVPLSVRRELYSRILERKTAARVEVGRGILSYVVDVTAIDDRIEQALSRYRDIMRLIVEDEAIQGGAATFRGTRILVHQIAELVGQGADTAELQEDYPRLTPEMIAAAPVYARAHPRRGRPRKPSWRAGPARIGPTREG